ncbi:LacI family DNA-binding transcriptional regulator [Olivibacter sp. SDN3]|uniref:LacI family DNA-binding transcriptional regulator n=1 Tax=Olivibacter sp. SDN3 TaxID=2764720 RepID=UPI001650F427|nr:LacI family DNA-binding transcriptional regulator [Olivibacter sp. SDN3]QNL49644.1 LacI family DNA-binding transcriptional regulator [Olivibacter sp. SDN3]
MAEKKLSINDIAKHLNVAKSTVSFIINGKAEAHRISKEQEQRVLQYVKEIGFKPHYMAQSLATGKSNSIGLIVENIGDSFFGPIALMIEEQAKKSGYRIIYSSTLGDTQAALSVLQLFRDTKVDGFIIAPPLHMEEAVQQVINEGVPVIIFDRTLDGVETDYVGTNNREMAEKACEHFLEQGFKEIAFVTLDSSQSQMQERLDGYLSCMQSHHRAPIILQMAYSEERNNRKQEIIDFLQHHPEVDAIFFATNYLCISGLEALRTLGKSIPDDVGVIVFDEHDLFRLFTPAITSIVQPLEQLSTKIIDTLLSRIAGRQTKQAFQQHILPSNLVVRESSLRKNI